MNLEHTRSCPQATPNSDESCTCGLKERAKIRMLVEALRDAKERMQRARDILTNCNPTPDCNWGVLDTRSLTAVLEQMG